MTDVIRFAEIVLLVAGAGLLAVISNRLSEKVRLPAPALFLIGAAILEKVVTALLPPPEQLVERIVTIALLCILFDGGMHLGWRRFRAALAPISAIGIGGTFLTAGAAAALCHFAFGFDWYLSLLLGTAVSPTDPAVVFSVLGRRQLDGRSGSILEGESGANDPVGIALMASLITAGGIDASGIAHVAGEFLLQMGVGLAIGLLGGKGLGWFMQRVPLPSEGLYPLRTLACAFVLYGATTLAHGSGFLAVFIAGIVVGDTRAPYKREIERFHSALASLAEIVVFTVLGLTIDLGKLAHVDVWLPGLILALVVSFVIRPVLVGLCLWPIKLKRNERTFILFAGLKGAVPILLASYLFAAQIPAGERIYNIVIIVVVFSVVFQAGAVPAVAKALRLPMHTVRTEPWALGVRLRDEPEGVARFTICAKSPADGHTVEEIAELMGNVWISMAVRDAELITIRADTTLHAGDEVLILSEPESHPELRGVFERPAAG